MPAPVGFCVLPTADSPEQYGEGLYHPITRETMAPIAFLRPTAVLSELAGRVYTIEIVEMLGRRAANTLERLGYNNVTVRVGDGYAGWPDQAPFDAILVTAAPEEVPEPLIEQLAVGGRIVIPVGAEN